MKARSRSIEAVLVHPLLRGRVISPWIASPDGYVVVTQDPADFRRLIEEKPFARRYPETLKWLRSHKASLRGRSVPNAS